MVNQCSGHRLLNLDVLVFHIIIFSFLHKPKTNGNWFVVSVIKNLLDRVLPPQLFENYSLQRWWSTESDATGSTSSYLGSQNMEFLGSLVEIGKMIWTPITKWFGYPNNIDENVQSLKRKIDDLSNQEDDINAELMNMELWLGKRRKKKVDIWLKEVHKIKGDLQKIEQEVVEGRNYISRLEKLVVEKLQEVVELQEKDKFSNGLGMIWESLMNDEVQKIGVFGMGGV